MIEFRAPQQWPCHRPPGDPHTVYIAPARTAENSAPECSVGHRMTAGTR